jgi:hypothetical protein
VLNGMGLRNLVEEGGYRLPYKMRKMKIPDSGSSFQKTMAETRQMSKLHASAFRHICVSTTVRYRYRTGRGELAFCFILRYCNMQLALE